MAKTAYHSYVALSFLCLLVPRPPSRAALTTPPNASRTDAPSSDSADISGHVADDLVPQDEDQSQPMDTSDGAPVVDLSSKYTLSGLVDPTYLNTLLSVYCFDYIALNR